MVGERWARSVEDLALLAIRNDCRVLGLISSCDSPVTRALPNAVAQSLESCGLKTLVLTLARSDGPSQRFGRKTFLGYVPQQLDLVGSVGPSMTSSRHFRTQTALGFRRNFEEMYKNYNKIIIEFPPMAPDADTLSVLEPCSACDMMLVICARGAVGKRQFGRVLNTLDLAGAKVSGIILDESRYQTLGQSIASGARRWSKLLPRLAAWVEKHATASEFLN